MFIFILTFKNEQKKKKNIQNETKESLLEFIANVQEKKKENQTNKQILFRMTIYTAYTNNYNYYTYLFIHSFLLTLRFLYEADFLRRLFFLFYYYYYYSYFFFQMNARNWRDMILIRSILSKRRSYTNGVFIDQLI